MSSSGCSRDIQNPYHCTLNWVGDGVGDAMDLHPGVWSFASRSYLSRPGRTL